MLWVICYLVTFVACVLGTICGMGGGIIIKPVLDATGVMSVSTITFLSGCTVIAMSCWNVGKNFLKKESEVELRSTGVLAVGAAIGGLLGKQLFTATAGLFADQNTAGGVQAVLLLIATLATLLYTLRKDRITSLQIASPVASLLIGLALGMLGAFLGIGGGPFNVAALCFFFSMPTKRAAQNSLFIVLFSQLTSTLKTVLFDGVPAFQVTVLLGMVLLGIAGSELGRRINKKIDNRQATLCLEGAMVLIMVISVFNIVKFFG
ncbi:MAG: TSUP family transporter [Faecousia sp.]